MIWSRLRTRRTSELLASNSARRLRNRARSTLTLKGSVRFATNRGNSVASCYGDLTAQVGISLRLVDDDTQAERRRHSRRPGSAVEHEAPLLLVHIPVEGTLHQMNQDQRQVRRLIGRLVERRFRHDGSERSRLNETAGRSAERSTSPVLHRI